MGLLAAKSASATEYYVATTGADSNAGTLDKPFATLRKAVNTAVAGDTVWIRGGTYSIATPATSGAGINFTKSGTSDGQQQDRRLAHRSLQCRLEEQGERFLRQPLVGREHLVQQHFVQQWHAVQHAGE
jgi:hypothetical protein